VKLLVDEDVAVEVVRCLRQRGHDVKLAFEVLGARTPDEDLWNYAILSGSIVLTCNRDDFLALAGTEPRTGLIIPNRRRTRQAECSHLPKLLANAGPEGLSRNINFA
jgi:predicted nuclease of predicted toxin-antitoxin system